MATPYRWRQFQFGNIHLETFPPSSNICFRTQNQLPEEQRCLLDNIWNSSTKNPRNFPVTLHALSNYFVQINNQFSHPPLSPPIHSLSLQPSTPERIKALEKENAILKNEIDKLRRERDHCKKEGDEAMKKVRETEKEKEEKEKREEKQEKEKKKEEKEKDLAESSRTDREGFFLFCNFPETSMDLHIKLQNIFWSLENSPVQPNGLAFGAITYKKDCCPDCAQGFTILVCSLDLSLFQKFTFSGLQINLNLLWKTGFLIRVVVTRPDDIENFPNWRLKHYLYSLFEELEFSFLDIVFEILPGLEQDDSRYKIHIVAQMNSAPLQRRNGLEHLRKEGCMKNQLLMWRSLALAVFPKITINDPLIFEESTIKVYCQYDGINVPFSGIIVTQPDKIEHMRSRHAGLSLHKFGDCHHYAIATRELLDSPLYSPPRTAQERDFFEDLDSVGLTNLENAMGK